MKIKEALEKGLLKVETTEQQEQWVTELNGEKVIGYDESVGEIEVTITESGQVTGVLM